MTTRTTRPLSMLAMASLGILAASAAGAETTFVLQADGGWSDLQTLAAQAAGGVVTFSHGETGIGIVKSDNPNFASDAAASLAFTAVTPDMMVQWQTPTKMGSAVMV